MSHPQLVEYFTDYFGRGESFKTISAARKQAAGLLDEPVAPGMAVTKLIDESIEAALVRVAREIVAQSTNTREAYDRLVELHQRQPILSVRSSTSVLQQAYSTPLPIAYAASTLADIQPGHTVYEPTAGHGALLIGSNVQTAQINELNPDRAADLRAQGFTVTEQDATAYLPTAKFDRIICNPPFGVVKQANGRTQQFDLPFNRRGTTQVDQAIALKALSAMQDDGRAVLILGGKLGQDAEKRSQRYNSLDSRNFFRTLYANYNVTQHFSVWGALYIKQGAGFPIDVIVIEGRGQSELYLPAARGPRFSSHLMQSESWYPMNEYSTYPKIFRPEPTELASLLMVRVPQPMQELTYKAYCHLLSQRIEWLIQQQLQQESQIQVHSQLEQALYHLNSSQQAPPLTSDPLWAWTSEWAATLLEYNDVLRQKLEQEFPVTLETMNSDQLEQWQSAHDQTTLTDWLTMLTEGMVTEAMLLSIL